MKICDNCRQEITSAHGYHDTGYSLSHWNCELRATHVVNHFQPIRVGHAESADRRLLRNAEGRKPNARPMAKESVL